MQGIRRKRAILQPCPASCNAVNHLGGKNILKVDFITKSSEDPSFTVLSIPLAYSGRVLTSLTTCVYPAIPIVHDVIRRIQYRKQKPEGNGIK